jgi:hypothetical protein
LSVEDCARWAASCYPTLDHPSEQKSHAGDPEAAKQRRGEGGAPRGCASSVGFQTDKEQEICRGKSLRNGKVRPVFKQNGCAGIDISRICLFLGRPKHQKKPRKKAVSR